MDDKNYKPIKSSFLDE